MASDVHLEPEPGSWPALARAARGDVAWRGRKLSEWKALTRRELGLPEDRIIIAAGHQAGFWHPGILAKFLAADAVVETIGRERACSLHLGVDQDDNDCVHMAVPAQGEDDALHVERVMLVAPPSGSWFLHSAYGSPMERPTGEFPALRALDTAEQVARPAIDSITPGLRSIEASLRGHERESSLAWQMAFAVNEHLEAWMSRPWLLCASQLLNTSLGREIVGVMRDDAVNCARAYNKAVKDGTGDVRPLESRGEIVELPLWRIDEDRKRQALFSNELNEIDLSCLRPRALLMTAIMRLVVCDLFIHGRGGVEYDAAMEKWIRDWLGLPVCPMTMATADAFLFRAATEPVFEADVEEARHEFRRILHDPCSSDGSAVSTEKREWLTAIAAAPRHSRERREKFLEYHRWLDEARSAHAPAIQKARDHQQQLIQLAATQEIISRRDWAFPLYPREMLDAIDHEIRARITRRSMVDIPAESPPTRGA